MSASISPATSEQPVAITLPERQWIQILEALRYAMAGLDTTDEDNETQWAEWHMIDTAIERRIASRA